VNDLVALQGTADGPILQPKSAGQCWLPCHEMEIDAMCLCSGIPQRCDRL